ncbi:MAG: fumarylacetoacetate hydrolase family protein, partial [Pyrinomonadaceae bacterium]
MKLCRVTHATFAKPRYGFIEGSTFHPLDEEAWFDTLAAEHSAFSVPLQEVRLLAPVAPSKIVCVGRNYREHAEELGNKMPDEPLLFLKAPSAIIADGETIELPEESKQVEHEGELAVVIGRKARRISAADDPLSFVLGYTCV